MKSTVITLRILYPLWAIVGMFSILYVPSQLIDSNNPVLSAQQIISNELLFRAGIVGSLITQLLFIVIACLLGQVFNNTHKNAVRWMLVLSLVSVPIAMLNELNQFAALMNVKNPAQMMFFLQLHQHGITIASVFWGLWLFPLGFLIYKSACVPKWIGILVVMAGAGYLCGTITKILNPDLSPVLSIFEALTVGEVIWMLWFSIAGTKKSWSAN
ncbi:MAG: DUF4386 domain-containing protein [Bacteroidetes bacterium]|nr:DUF4386 domain-containing protein [Bacteroidota bacterium]